MEIIVYCTLPENESRCTIQVDGTQKVDEVIKAFCTENGIKYESAYILKTRSDEQLNKRRLISSYNLQSGDVLFLVERDVYRWPCGCNQWWILFITCFIIGCIGIIAVSLIYSNNNSPVYSYGVGIDAGSSHTQLYVYRWPTGKTNGTGIVSQIFSCPEKGSSLPPISAFVNNTSEAGNQCVKPCLDKVLKLKALPSAEHSKTPVFLGATAGMRLLRLSNNKSAEAIMSSIRETIASYPFLVSSPEKQLRIIEGNEEGTFSWITTNYVSGSFGFQPMGWLHAVLMWQQQSSFVDTVGALDMGGASTQMTFVPENSSSISPDYEESLTLYGNNYRVYTHSYQCYGLNEGRRRYLALLVTSEEHENQTLDDPCSLKGDSFTYSHGDIFKVPCTLNVSDQLQEKKPNYTFLGTGESDRCHEITRHLFNFNATCHYPTCSFDGVYQPELFNDFLGFSGFYYTVEFLNLTKIHSISENDYKRSMDSYCNSTISEVSSRDDDTPFCFNAHFIFNLLVDGYGFRGSKWNSIRFTNNVNGIDLGWILGMMINATNVIPSATKSDWITLPLFVLLLVLFCVFLVLSFAFVYHARRWRHREYEMIPSYEPI